MFSRRKAFVKKVNGVSRIVRDSYGGSKWFALANEIRELHQFTCCSCGTYIGKGKGDVHHIIPLSRGGTTTKRNLTLLCSDCHSNRHSHMRKL